jgi:RHS repeat-associated protein
VGGLLKVAYYGTTTTNCFVAYDGNGNVSALINAADGTTPANYEYGPFGELLRMSGPIAKLNPFRFSTKYDDDESDFLYYACRYYNPSTGRWLSRDPAEEPGGFNLYGMIANDSVNKYDLFGLTWSIQRFGDDRAMAYPDNGDTIRGLARQIALNPSEWTKWLVRESTITKNIGLDTPLTGCDIFSVPNTAYLDVNAYTAGFIRYWLWGYRTGLQQIWNREGLKVVYTYTASKQNVMDHLHDHNLYRYLFIGHGGGGLLVFGDNESDFVSPAKYTLFGIAEMQLIACGTDSSDTWKEDVSKHGLLIRVAGVFSYFHIHFTYSSGDGSNGD